TGDPRIALHASRQQERDEELGQHQEDEQSAQQADQELHSVPAAQAGDPASSQCWKTAIRSSGQAPSQGIVPSRRRSRMAAPFFETSSWDKRSKAQVFAARSPSRKRGMMSWS